MHTEDQSSTSTEIAPPVGLQIEEDSDVENAGVSLRAETKDRINLTRTFLIGAVAVVLLLSVALYNGYPTVFSDTGSYLLTGAFFVAFVPFRAPGYSMFTRFAGLGTSGWYIVAMQAVLVIYVLYETCDYLVGRDPKVRDYFLLASACVLTVLTSLSWVASMLMPDVFAGALFLSAFMLAFAGDLGVMRRILLAGILTLSVAAHSSFLPIAVLCVAAFAVLSLAGRWLPAAPPKKSALAWLLVPIMVAGLWTANLNREMGLGFRLAPSRNMFLLARLFADGLAGDFLRENCPKEAFISCKYLSDLPQTPEQFLFWHPLLSDLAGHEDEMKAIARGTIRAYPIRFAARSARDTLLQLASMRTGDEVRTYGAAQWNNDAIEQVFPGDFQTLLLDRQFRNRLLPLADSLAPVHTVFFWLSVGTCLYFARTRRFEKINMFFYSAVAFLLINAAVCATFAGVYDRYQNRVAWIIPLCTTAYICCLAREWKRGDATSFAPTLSTYEADAIPPGNS